MPDPDEVPGWIEVDDPWTLHVDIEQLETAIAAWQHIAGFASGRADVVTDTSAVLLGSDWSGRTRDSFETLRKNLVTDLDEGSSLAESASETIRDISELVHDTEQKLHEIGSRIDHLPHTKTERWLPGVQAWSYSFWVENDADVQLVQNAIEDAWAAREELKGAVVQLGQKFDPDAWRLIRRRWDPIATGIGADQNSPQLEGTPADPFVLPDFPATGTWVTWSDDSKIASTATPLSEVAFRFDEASSMYVVEFEDKTERFVPGAYFTLHTGDGKVYNVHFGELTAHGEGKYSILDMDTREHVVGWEDTTRVEKPSDIQPMDIVPLAP